MVRPSGFEPPTFCSGGSGRAFHPFVFIGFISARTVDFGAFGVNWVGIWVGKKTFARGQTVSSYARIPKAVRFQRFQEGTSRRSSMEWGRRGRKRAGLADASRSAGWG